MTVYKYYSNLYDFIDYISKESDSVQKKSREIENQSFNDLFFYSKDFSSALDIYKSGYLSIYDSVKEIHIKNYELLSNLYVKDSFIYSTYGYNPDIFLYLCKEPEYFVLRRKVKAAQGMNIVKLVYSLSAASFIQPNLIIERGALLCAFIDFLENSGIRVELLLNMASGNRGHLGEVDIKLKDSFEPLNIPTLLFPMCHPSMLRRFYFSWLELEGLADLLRNYGTPKSPTNQGDININALTYETYKNNQNIEFIKSTLKNIGICI